MTFGNRRRIAQTVLQCEECGNVVTIFRVRNLMKRKYHKKHMYCYKCKDDTAHIEVKEDAFLPDWLKEDDTRSAM